MGFWNEYNPEFGVVFDDWDDFIKSLQGGSTTGTKPTAGTPPTYAQSSLQDKKDTLAGQPGIFQREQLAAQGGRQINANQIQLPDGSKYSLRSDGTGLYQAAGAALGTKQDVAIWNAAAPLGGATTPTPTPGVTPGLSSPLGARDFTSLPSTAGPQIQGWDAFIHPGGLSSEGRQTLGGVSTGLNSMVAGRQGSATPLFPVSPGFRQGPGQLGNNINFVTTQPGSNSLQPQNLFGETSVSVPGTYVSGQGNVGASNRGYSVPFNIGPNGAGLMNIGGNNVQIQSADRGTGYGYVLNAMPHSNVGALTGRDLSDDPARQAAQILMLNSAIAQGRMGDLMAVNPNQFGGNPAGTGNGPWSGNGGMGQNQFWAGYSQGPTAFTAPPPAVPINYGPIGGGVANMGGSVINAVSNAVSPPNGGMIGNTIANTITGAGRDVVAGSGVQTEEEAAALRGYSKGGRVATGPLGGKPDQVTNEPIIAIGMMTGKPHFIAGEDNADADSRPNPEMISIKPMPGYATGTTGGISTAAPVTALPAPPPLPTATTTPVIDSGPEVQSALNTARIQQQQQTQNQIRARAGLGGATAIRTNAKLEGLPPGYYTTPPDYSEQVGGLQTQLAGLGPISSDPNSLLTYQNTLKQMSDPLKEAQGIETELLGLGTLGDPSQLQQEISRVNTLSDPLKTAQAIQNKILGFGQTGDPATLLEQINTIKLQAGPLATIQEADQKLAELGQPYGLDAIQSQSGVIEGYEQQIKDGYAQMALIGANPTLYGQGAATQLGGIIQNAEQNLANERNRLSQMFSRNNAIEQTSAQLNNLLINSGLTREQIAPQLAQFNAALDAAEQGYKNALDVAGLRAQLTQYAPPGTNIDAILGQYQAEIAGYQQQIANAGRGTELQARLANYVPAGTSVAGRLGELTGLSDQARSMYENTIKAGDIQRQIASYRNSTEIEGITQDEAPAPVIAQAVVSTPALKAISQSDPASANAIAKLDYALSNGAWTPASSQALVNLTNSLSGSKAKDSIQAMLQSLIARMGQSGGVPPAVAAAAQTGDASKIGAAAKFGMAA